MHNNRLFFNQMCMSGRNYFIHKKLLFPALKSPSQEGDLGGG